MVAAEERRLERQKQVNKEIQQKQAKTAEEAPQSSN